MSLLSAQIPGLGDVWSAKFLTLIWLRSGGATLKGAPGACVGVGAGVGVAEGVEELPPSWKQNHCSGQGRLTYKFASYGDEKRASFLWEE